MPGGCGAVSGGCGAVLRGFMTVFGSAGLYLGCSSPWNGARCLRQILVSLSPGGCTQALIWGLVQSPGVQGPADSVRWLPSCSGNEFT